MQGTLHTYHATRSLLLFEHLNLSSTSSSTSSTNNGPPNTLLLVGGMFDNFLTPPYTTDLARLLRHSTHWRLVHVQLSSAMRGFGVSSLAKDVSELAVAVQFIRDKLHGESLPPNDSGAAVVTDRQGAGRRGQRPPGKIVLLGHSTGCQDALSYLCLASPSSPLASRPKVDGIILQAPVSDRDSATPNPLDNPSPDKVKAWEACLTFAHSVTTATTPPGEKAARTSNRSGTTILPLHLTTPFFGPAPLSVARFLSLASPDSPQAPREDDLFSSDTSEEWLGRTWGRALGAVGDGHGDGGGTGVLNLFPSPLPSATKGDTEQPDGGLTGLEPTKGAQRGTAPSKRQILLLPSAADEHVPAWVDKAALLRKWTVAVRKAGGEVHEQSALVEGGVHDLGGDGVEERWGRLVEMRGRVVRYLDGVLGGVGGGGGGGSGRSGEEAVWRVWEDEKAELEREREQEKEGDQEEKESQNGRKTGGGDGVAHAHAGAGEQKTSRDAPPPEATAAQGAARARGASASKI